jgi:hypothetical protein
MSELAQSGWIWRRRVPDAWRESIKSMVFRKKLRRDQCSNFCRAAKHNCHGTYGPVLLGREIAKLGMRSGSSHRNT